MGPRETPNVIYEGGRLATPLMPAKDATCLSTLTDETHASLSRANEIVETIISRIEGPGKQECGKPESPDSQCLMNRAVDCNDAARVLVQRVDYLARLITGSR